MFSYENQTKINFKNKENEFTIVNILYMNQKTIMCYFLCFRIKSKTLECDYFLLFFLFRLPLRFSSYQTHENMGL